MSFNPRTWHDKPQNDTPLDAVELNDFEARITNGFTQTSANDRAYTDARVASIPIGPIGPQGPPGPGGPPGVNYRGVWAGGTTYNLNDWTKGSDGLYYFAVQGSNTGHSPTTDTTETWWAPQSSRSVAIVSQMFMPSGGDDGAIFQAALTAHSGAGTFLLGPGTFQWQTTPQLGHGGVRIIGSGRSRTTIQLSATAPVAFGIDNAGYTAQTVSDITIEDLTVDSTGVTNVDGPAIIGNYSQRGARTSFARIAVRRVRAIGLQTPSATYARHGIWIGSQHASPGDGSSTITDIVVDDVEVLGGNTGLAINGTGASGADTFIDRIYVPLFKHDAVTATTNALGCSGLQIGSYGYCGTVKLGHITSIKCGDCSIEVDNCRDLHAETLIVEDTMNVGIYIRNIGYAVRSTQIPSQMAHIDHIYYRQVAQPGGRVFSMVGNTQTTRYGNLFIGSLDCVSVLASGNRMAPCNLNHAAFDSIEFDSITVTDTVMNDAVSANNVSVVWLSPNSDQSVRIRSLRATYAGTMSNANMTGLVIVTDDSGATAKLNLKIDSAVISSTATFKNEYHYIGLTPASSGVTLSGYIHGFRVESAGTPFYGAIAIWGTSVLAITSLFEMRNLDFSGMGGGTEIYYNNPTNITNCVARAVRWRATNPSGANVPTVGASPWTWRNAYGKDGTLYLYGGTVSQVVGRSSGVIAQATNCGIQVISGDSITVTYSVAPTARFVPDV
jgi:hypothetical protein